MITDEDKKKKKSNTRLMIISVVVMTILTLSVSYSAFFDVRLEPSVHAFTAGTLNVTITGDTANLGGTELKPSQSGNLPSASDTPAAPESGYVKVTLTNTGDIPASFSMSISDNELPAGTATTDRLDAKYINIGIYDESGSWQQIGSGYNAKLSDVQKGGDGGYTVLTGAVSSGSPKIYRIYVWLSQDTPTSEIGKLVYYNINVHSVPQNGQQAVES